MYKKNMLNEKIHCEDLGSKKNCFKDYYLKIKSDIAESKMCQFAKLQSDEERIRFVSEELKLTADQLPPLKNVGNSKNEKIGKELREKGNKMFTKGEYDKALNYYSESIFMTPFREETTELGLAYANRSAVLYYLQDYSSAVSDINTALDLKYPEELCFKVLERKAKCLLALSKPVEALLEFQKTITALKDAKISSEKKHKIQTDVKIMMEILLSNQHPNKDKEKVETSKEGPENSTLRRKKKMETTGSQNEKYEAASSLVEFVKDDLAGRYAIASSNISPGDTLIIEKPYCSVLLQEYGKTHCENCFKRIVIPYPCNTCTTTAFCSLTCKQSAPYHNYECSIFPILNQLGVSVTVRMALRIFTQSNFEYFHRQKNTLKDSANNWKKYKSSDYARVYNLVRHEKLRTTEDFFERTIMALFLLRCLINANYFITAVKDNDLHHTLSLEEIYVGSLLLRNLQILQFNAHEISELEMHDGKLDNSKSNFIGGGLYPTLSLFNHSCDPGIVRYFDGSKVIVRAVKPIQTGEIIAENYGPIYSQMEKYSRQEKLLSQYWFKCDCIPCQELWPTFQELDNKIMRFRCNAPKNGIERKKCGNILLVPITSEDFLIKCPVCNEFTNLLKGLKELQNTDALHVRAVKASSLGNFEVALKNYFKNLSVLHEILAPPFKDYLLCQQSIRKNMLALGNIYHKNTKCNKINTIYDH